MSIHVNQLSSFCRKQLFDQLKYDLPVLVSIPSFNGIRRHRLAICVVTPIAEDVQKHHDPRESVGQTPPPVWAPGVWKTTSGQGELQGGAPQVM